jgi:BlaI family transcriptional regulator, penicillinase repressor
MSVPRLGKLQMRIMQILWERGEANAREITEELNKENPVAHSTVQTLLRKIEAKGAVAHKSSERTFIYYPLVQESKITHSVTREIIDRIFDGSAGGLISYLLQNEKISKNELDDIRRLIEEKEKQS